MDRNVLAVADLRGRALRSVTFEILAGARAVCGRGRVTALLMGHEVSEAAERLFAAGADEVLTVDRPELAQYNPDLFCACVEAAADRAQAQLVLFAHSAVGRDLAPMLAARRRAGQVSDAIAIAEQADGSLVFTRSIYAGKAFARVRANGDPVVATVRPNNLPAAALAAGRTGTPEPLSVELPANLRTTLRSVARKQAGGVDLAEARIIVSGGRGVKSAEGFRPLYELAAVLGAAVGASRGACDAGYCDYSLQIGQTGKVVTPDLYIACGISGAIQHLAGMSNAKVIVAVNKDPEAPIFKVADYGIVGDLFEVVPALTAELSAIDSF